MRMFYSYTSTFGELSDVFFRLWQSPQKRKNKYTKNNLRAFSYRYSFALLFLFPIFFPQKISIAPLHGKR